MGEKRLLFREAEGYSSAERCVGTLICAYPGSGRRDITIRYLRYQKTLTRVALARLAELDENPIEEEDEVESEVVEAKRPLAGLHDLRIEAAVEAIVASGARRVLDLGCGEGRLIKKLLPKATITEVVGVDVTLRSLEKVKTRLRWDQMPDKLKAKLKLVHGSITYRDADLSGYDAAALVEVIEHLDLPRLASVERVVFEFAKPRTVIVTTPNREYNSLFEKLNPESFRHGDHRFEWTREEFGSWCDVISAKFGYSYSITPIGPIDETHGAPSQMAVFTL